MKWEAYPEYKASGVEWLGPVPAHWQVNRLKRFATLKSGETITYDGIEPEGLYPVYGGNGLRGYCDEYTHEGHFVLLGRQGALCGNVNYASGRFWASEHAVVVTPKVDLTVSWLGELLWSMDLNQYSQSAAQPGIAVERIRELYIPVPPWSEQQAIGDFIESNSTRIDVLITKKRELIERLNEKRTALISRTAISGLPPDAAAAVGLDPAPPLKPTGIDWIADVPRHWTLTRLRRCAAIQTGVTLGKECPEDLSESRPYLRVANVQDGYLDLTEIKETVVLSAEASRFALRSGDVLMTEGGDFDKLGRGCVWYGEVAGCLHQNHIFAVRPDTRKLLPEYLSLAMTSDVGKHHFTRTAQQSTNLATTNQAKIKDFAFPLPPLPEQRAILDWMALQETRFRNVEGRMRDAIGELEEYRSALITAAVTGKIDVRGWQSGARVSGLAASGASEG